MRSSVLPYGRQCIEEDDVSAVAAALRSDWITTGPRVGEFEARVAERVGARHAVAVNSGTAALHAALDAAPIRLGDEVIVPALTFAASANAVLYVGGTPVFADVRPDTFNLDPADVRRRLTPRTRAIVTVDYAGHPSDLDALGAVAREHGIVLIEDAAHALGAEYRGRPVGAIADLTTFSFHPVKAITTGEGGMVTTGDAERARRMRRFRNHGIETEAADRFRAGAWHYDMVELGFNYRLTDLQCALGLSQLDKLERFVARRAAIADRYRRALHGVPGLTLQAVAADVRHAWHLFVVVLTLEAFSGGRAEIAAALRAEGVGVSVHYAPVYRHPFYRGRGDAEGSCPVAERLAAALLTVPLFPAMTDADADSVVEALVKVVEHYRERP